jgi:hypothetical protein
LVALRSRLPGFGVFNRCCVYVGGSTALQVPLHVRDLT